MQVHVQIVLLPKIQILLQNLRLVLWYYLINGFNVQDLFLSRQVKCVLPPFVRSKRQFTRSEVYQGKRIARARIHVERVMGRLKEFRLLNHVLPINMIDLCDHIWNVAGAIVEYAACFGKISGLPGERKKPTLVG